MPSGERFARQVIKSTEQCVKILIGGNDGGIVGITASGQIIHIPPDSPVQSDQSVMEFMRTVHNTFPTTGKVPYLTPCDVINSRIANIERLMAELAAAGIDSKLLDSELQALESTAEREHCQSVRVPANPAQG